MRTSLQSWLLRWSVGLVACWMATVAVAQQVDLSTVPKRDTVQLTIYNSEDLTLVRETRTITFKKGINPLQFSWAGTKIDPSSVELKFLSHADQLEVLDTTFPHAKPQMLYWNVNSEHAGEATVQISYFTSGISWSADYVAIADKEEKQLSLEGFVKIQNASGEEYEDAQVRLVVGTINLVEKIAQLAGIQPEAVANMPAAAMGDLRMRALRESAAKPMAAGAAAPAADAPAPAPKEIVKEGLSEYFIYTIEGTESVPNGWSKRMRSLDAAGVPFRVEYRYRPREYGDHLVRMYLWTNDVASKLGTTPLPDGTVRVFRDNGRDGLSFLTQQQVKYIPIGDKTEINLGVDPEVVFEQRKLKVFREKIWLVINGTNQFRMIGEDGVKVVENSSIAGWDEHEMFVQRIGNYTGRPIDVEIRREWEGHIVFRSSLNPKLFDFKTVEMKTSIPAGKRGELKYEVIRSQGTNAKQNNITLQNVEVLP